MSVTAFLPSLPLPSRQSPRISSRIRINRRLVPLAVAPPPTPPLAPPPTAPPPVIAKPLSKHDKLPTPPSPPPPQPQPSQFPLSYLWPRLLLLSVAVIWGTNFPIVKILHTPPDPVHAPTAALARFTLAAVAMLPFIPGELKASNRQFFPMPFLISTFVTGASIAAGYFAQSISLTTADASTTAFICSLSVVVVPILTRIANKLGWIPHHEDRGLLATWGAPLLAVVGVAMLEFGGTPPTAGDAWAFVQAIGFALGFIINDRVISNYPDLVLSQSAIQLNVVSALALLWAVTDSSATAGAFAFPHISDAFTQGTNALSVMYTGLIATALTVCLENIALKRVSAGELAVLLSTEPFWAAALAVILLGETMGPSAIAGAAVILIACLLNQLSGVNVPDILASRKPQEKTKRDVTSDKETLVAMFNRKEHR